MIAPDGYRYKQAYHDLAVAMEYIVTDCDRIATAYGDTAALSRMRQFAEDAVRRSQFFITEGEQMQLSTATEIRERTREFLRGLT